MKRSKSKKIRSRLGLEVTYCRYCGYGFGGVYAYYREGDRYMCCNVCGYVYDTQKDKEIWDKNQVEQIKSKAKRIEEERYAKQAGALPFPDFAVVDDEEGLPFNC